MSERGSDPDSYLSEIDRRLQSIQGELQPGRARPNQPPRRRGRGGPLAAILGRADRPRSEPGAPAPEPASEPSDERAPGSAPSTLEQEVHAIGELQERLIDAIEGLVEAYEAPIGDLGAVTLKAGPFADTGALRVFTERLAALPGVEKVTVTGFEGADRAIVDVELDSAGPLAPANT
jgi:hypothetical protein